MATKTKPKVSEVGVMFRAPQEIRGAVRRISAWAEMNNFRINGKVPLEKDIWAWMASSLYAAGEDNWGKMLQGGAESFRSIAKPSIENN